VLGLLCGRTFGDQGGARVEQTDVVRPLLRRARGAQLLEEDEVLARSRVATAVLAWPVDARVARLEHEPLPTHVVRPAGDEVVLGPNRRHLGESAGQPCP
jgi:hypothetical protein